MKEAFAPMSQKLRWLSSKYDKKNLFDLENSLSRYAFSLLARHLPKAYISYIVFDLMYSLLKYERWHNSSLFKKIILHNFIDKHKVAGDLSLQIIDQFIEEINYFKDVTLKYFVLSSDENYLLYVFVKLMSNEDHRLLVDDLAVGPKLLKCFDSSAEYLASTGSVSDDQVIFLTQLEEAISELIEGLSVKIQKNPWLLDVCRLQFHLKEIPEDLASLIESAGVKLILEVLVHVGLKEELSSSKLAAYMRSSSANSVSEEQAKALISFCHDCGLLDRVNYRSENIWAASSLSYSLTATIFGLSCDKLSISLKKYSKFNKEWQRSFLENTQDYTFVYSLVEKMLILDPACLLYASKFLEKKYKASMLANLLSPLVKKGVTAKIREAAQGEVDRLSFVG